MVIRNRFIGILSKFRMKYYWSALLLVTFIVTGTQVFGDQPSKPVTMIDTRLSRDKPKEVFSCWLVYASVRRAYQKETFFKDNPGTRDYRYTFKEELEARRLLSDAWTNVKKQDSGVSDAYLDALAEVKGAGFLPEYVWYFFWDPGWGDDAGSSKFRAFDEWRKQRLVDHLAETVAYPDSSGENGKKGEAAVLPGIIAVPAGDPARIKAAREYFDKGVKYQKSRDYVAAIDEYLKAVKRDPAYTDAMDNLGLSYRAAGNYDAAEKWFIKSLSVQPKNKAALKNLAIVYRLKGRVGQEMEVYQRMIEIDPEDPEGHYGLGGVLYAKGEYDKSIKSLDVAINAYKHQNSPYLSHACATQGFNYLMLKNWKKAIEYLELARPGLPDDPRIKNATEFARKQLEGKAGP
jgi:tetratricopeptide (TPR) repeat protein